MSRKHHAHPRPRDATRRGSGWRLAGLIAAGLAVLAGGIILTHALTSRDADTASATPELHAKGPAAAPVTLVEWGDFQ